MSSDGGNVEGAGGVPQLGVSEDIRDVISASREGGMGVVIGGRGIVGDRDVAYEVINSEETGYYCGVYHEPPNL